MLPRLVMTLLLVVLLAILASAACTSRTEPQQNPPTPPEETADQELDKPAPPEQTPVPEVDKPAVKEESAEVRGRKLLDKVIEANGGAKLEAVTELTWFAEQSEVRGTGANAVKVDSNIHGRVRFPASMRQDISRATRHTTFCVNGKIGWTHERGKASTSWPAQTVQAWRTSLSLSTLPLLVDHKNLKVKEVDGFEENDGTYPGISVTRAGMGEVIFYVHPKTYRVRRRKNIIASNAGPVTREEKLWDYRKVDDVWLPFSRAIERNGKTTAIISVSQYRLNEKFDAKIFEQPKATNP